MAVSSFGDARAFLRQKLGMDWDRLLAQADAVVRGDATNEEVDAAQQRAVDLVSEVTDDWTLETREQVAEAWRVLNGRS
jgi:hypothetical protein